MVTDNTTTTTDKTPTNGEQIQPLIDGLKKVMEVNGYKPDTKAAATCELAFLQGACVANPKLTNNPLLVISMMSGRSILTL
jgi:hypothetical protein